MRRIRVELLKKKDNVCFVTFGERDYFSIAKYEDNQIKIIDKFKVKEASSFRRYKNNFIKAVKNNVDEGTNIVYIDEKVNNYIKQRFHGKELFN